MVNITQVLAAAAASAVSLALFAPAAGAAGRPAPKSVLSSIDASIQATSSFSGGELTAKTWVMRTSFSSSTGTSVELSKPPSTVVQRSGKTPEGVVAAEYLISSGGETARFATTEDIAYLPLDSVIETYSDSITPAQAADVLAAAEAAAPGVDNPYVAISQDSDVPPGVGSLFFGYSLFLTMVIPRELRLTPADLKGGRGSIAQRPDGSSAYQLTMRPQTPTRVNGKKVSNYSVAATVGTDGAMRSYTFKYGKLRAAHATWAPQDIVLDLSAAVPIDILPLPASQ